MNNKRTQVVIVDDYVPYRESLVEYLRATPDIDVLGQGDTASDAVRLALLLAPDVLLLDLDMPGGGLEAARRLAAACPAVRVLVLTVSDDPVCRTEASLAGVAGYLLKGISARALAEAIRADE